MLAVFFAASAFKHNFLYTNIIYTILKDYIKMGDAA